MFFLRNIDFIMQYLCSLTSLIHMQLLWLNSEYGTGVLEHARDPNALICENVKMLHAMALT